MVTGNRGDGQAEKGGGVSPSPGEEEGGQEGVMGRALPN